MGRRKGGHETENLYYRTRLLGICCTRQMGILAATWTNSAGGEKKLPWRGREKKKAQKMDTGEKRKGRKYLYTQWREKREKTKLFNRPRKGEKKKVLPAWKGPLRKSFKDPSLLKRGLEQRRFQKFARRRGEMWGNFLGEGGGYFLKRKR